jgi:hypothetical protein
LTIAVRETKRPVGTSTKEAAVADEPVGAIVVRESNAQRNLLYGFVTLALAVAVLRGLLSHPSSLTLTAVVVLALVLVLMVAAWWRTWRDPYRIEVSVERVCYLGRHKSEYRDMAREDGIDLWLYARPVGRSEVLVLEQPASDLQWTLRFFGRQPIIDACMARGWSVTSTRTRPS